MGGCEGRSLLLGLSVDDCVRGRCGWTVNVLFFIALNSNIIHLCFTLIKTKLQYVINSRIKHPTRNNLGQLADKQTSSLYDFELD